MPPYYREEMRQVRSKTTTTSQENWQTDVRKKSVMPIKRNVSRTLGRVKGKRNEAGENERQEEGKNINLLAIWRCSSVR